VREKSIPQEVEKEKKGGGKEPSGFKVSEKKGGLGRNLQGRKLEKKQSKLRKERLAKGLKGKL